MDDASPTRDLRLPTGSQSSASKGDDGNDGNWSNAADDNRRNGDGWGGGYDADARWERSDSNRDGWSGGYDADSWNHSRRSWYHADYADYGNYKGDGGNDYKYSNANYKGDGGNDYKYSNADYGNYKGDGGNYKGDGGNYKGDGGNWSAWGKRSRKRSWSTGSDWNGDEYWSHDDVDVQVKQSKPKRSRGKVSDSNSGKKYVPPKPKSMPKNYPTQMKKKLVPTPPAYPPPTSALNDGVDKKPHSPPPSAPPSPLTPLNSVGEDEEHRQDVMNEVLDMLLASDYYDSDLDFDELVETAVPSQSPGSSSSTTVTPSSPKRKRSLHPSPTACRTLQF